MKGCLQPHLTDEWCDSLTVVTVLSDRTWGLKAFKSLWEENQRLHGHVQRRTAAAIYQSKCWEPGFRGKRTKGVWTSVRSKEGTWLVVRRGLIIEQMTVLTWGGENKVGISLGCRRWLGQWLNYFTMHPNTLEKEIGALENFSRPQPTKHRFTVKWTNKTSRVKNNFTRTVS